jgi:hypothetical protein
MVVGLVTKPKLRLLSHALTTELTVQSHYVGSHMLFTGV